MAEQTVTIVTQARKPASKSGVSFYVDTSQLKQVAKGLKAANPAVAKNLRTRLRDVGAIVATEAKDQASWSTKIPASIAVRTNGFSVRVIAGGPKAPDGTPYEHGGAPGEFRHPVFGNRDVWVGQKARPFLAPALSAKADEVEVIVEDIIETTLREVGLLE